MLSTSDELSTRTTGKVHGERRSTPRVAARFSATCRRSSAFLALPKQQVDTAVITDYGQNGACLRLAKPIQVGEWVSLRLEQQYARPQTTLHAKQRVIIVREANDDQRRSENSDGNFYTYGVRFGNDFPAAWSYAWYRTFPLAIFLLFLAGAANVLYLKSNNVTLFWYSPLFNVYSLLISIYILSRFALASFYRPPKNVGYSPSISAIVVCKNEEASIGKTLDCIFRSDYPHLLMEVIAVNDGSTDYTLMEMELAQLKHPALRIISFPKNRGKRHGMAAGARAASGEILVYIDSDSFVRRDTMRNLVRSFKDASVGAVCGHANVQNARANLLTKMQEVRYFVAFRVVKAAESLLSAVSCCSGCLAAYRRSYVMPILDVWLNQRFLGTEATFGDDRSLTNFMLRRYRVLYDSEAVCTTIVPDNYRVFFRQQLRWKKSWIRESLIGSMFMWRRHPLAAFFYYLGVLFPLIAPIIVLKALFLPLLGIGTVSYLYIYGVVLMASLYGLTYLARYRDSLWVYGISFSVFYMTILVWQTYYAVLTVRRNHWGTR
jgi:hyaluronan synthase